MVPSPEPAEGVATAVLVSPYLSGEAGVVIEIVRVALLMVSVEVTRVTAVYESRSETGVIGSIV